MKKEITMIRFETINGTLCRMVEPEPLQLDSQIPCLTRLIQDDSRMGMFNRDTKPNRLSDFYLAARIVNNNIIVDEFMESDYHRFEIIGYPVVEGSHWWALYQMKLGDKVTKRHLISHVYWHYDARPHLKCISEYNCGTLQIMVVPEIWLTTADPTGWQIYKEPEQPKYKVGDWVTDGVVVGHVAVINDGKAWVKTKDAQYHLSVEHLRKLKPSEVVLGFGSGIKGTVRSCEHDGGCVRVISGDRVIAHIMTDVLEQPTRNLVMQLLKAQEEEE